MKYTLNIDELKEKIPEIFFSEWDKKWNKIRLLNAENPRISTLDSTIYYVFRGNFESKQNFTDMSQNIHCLFWISKQCFDKEIIRHIDFWKIDKNCAMDISFDMKRTSQRKIHIKNLKLNNNFYLES